MAKAQEISYLQDLSSSIGHLPTSISNVLKASYMSQYSSTLRNLPSDSYLTTRCPRCNVDISNTAKFQISSKKIGKFAKTIRKRIELGSYLTEYQQRYAKDMSASSSTEQIMINITCNICKKQIKKYKSERKPLQNPIVVEDVTPPVISKNKRKRVDKFCGLNVEAVQSSSNKINILQQSNKKSNKDNRAQLTQQTTSVKSKKLHQNNKPKSNLKDISKNPFVNFTHKPTVVNTVRKDRLARFKANKAKAKTNQKLGQMLGLSFPQASVKSKSLNNFFQSF